MSAAQAQNATGLLLLAMYNQFRDLQKYVVGQKNPDGSDKYYTIESYCQNLSLAVGAFLGTPAIPGQAHPTMAQLPQW